MGCFNVADSISGISIDCGDKVAFIPLVPRSIYSHPEYGKCEPGQVRFGPDSNLVSNEGCYYFFNCFSLPIFGKYNDYGSVEDIEESPTTKALEKYFGITINAFMECLTVGRGVYDEYSGYFPAYLEEECKDPIKSYDVKFNSRFLDKFGFKRIPKKKNHFSHKSSEDFTVKIENFKHEEHESWSGWIFSILDKDGNVAKTVDHADYDTKGKFLNAWFELTDFYLGVKKEKQEQLKELETLSGMFVHYDIYRNMVEVNYSEWGKLGSDTEGSDGYVDEKALKIVGFEFDRIDESVERYNKIYKYPGVDSHVIHSDGKWCHIVEQFEDGSYNRHGGSTYHLPDLEKEWKNATGVDLNISEDFLKQSKYSRIFDEMQEIAKQHLSLKKDSREERKEKLWKDIGTWAEGNPSDREVKLAKQIFGDHEVEELKERMIKLYMTFIKQGSTIFKEHSGISLGDYSSEETPFDKLYIQDIADGTIKKDVIDYMHFYWTAFSCNKIFMPAANGYQHGNHYATRELARKTMEIMDEKLKEREDED